jgi:hypothetical protein
MRAYFPIILIAAAAGFLFLVRLLAAPVSRKVRDQMQRHPVVHWVWAVVGLAGLLVAMDPSQTVHRFFLRREWRAEALARVERVGGWEALRRNCERLVTEHPEGLELAWPKKSTNGLVYRREPGWWNTNWSADWETFRNFILPAELEPLRPHRIHYVPSRFVTNGPPVELVDLTIWGGRGYPSRYGFRVVCGAAAHYQPTRKDSQMPDGRHWKRFHPVAEGVFEVCY